MTPIPLLPGLTLWRTPAGNSYLWQTTLIDPGPDLTPAIVGPVTDILITHLQAESAAGCLNFPTSRLHVPVGDEYLCRGPAEYAKLITPWPPPWDWDSRGNFHGHVAGAANERPLPQPVALAESLQPGRSLCGFEVLATPGHGKHAVTLLATIAGQRVAFCGDLACGDGRLWNWFDSEWDYGMQAGQLTLRDSARQLATQSLDWLCPAHGEISCRPRQTLQTLVDRLDAVLRRPKLPPATPAPFTASPARGFRQLLPHLHQWTQNAGNCNVLLSDTGHALLIDDGLCQWIPLPERAAHHRAVIADLKRTLGIRRIETVIPTHFHGDHVENIPELVALENAEVICLDLVADVLEHPERFNLACPLPWYGTSYDTVAVHRRVPTGKRLRWHEYELEIFHLAGQTYYHAGIATVIDGRRVVFAGDDPNPVGLEPVICYNDNEPAERGWLFAARQLAERRPQLVVYGHADAVSEPDFAPKIRAWEEMLQRFADLSAQPDRRAFFDPFYSSRNSGACR